MSLLSFVGVDSKIKADPEVEAPTIKVLAFKATWCRPCQEAEPKLKELEKDGYKICRFDVDKEPELAKKWKVNALPMLIVVHDHGDTVKEVFRTTRPSRLKDWLVSPKNLPNHTLEQPAP